MIRAAIIGSWGRILVDSVQGKSAAIRFTRGATRTRATAEAFCGERGIALAEDLAAILKDPAIDAVVFATPHSRHAAEVIACAEAGKHVFMEKPFTLDRKSAEAALTAVERAGVVLGVGYPRRFHPAVKELQGRLADGRLGVIGHGAAEQTTPSGLAMPSHHWRADPREAPAGAMTASGVHNLDLMIFLFGRIAEVYCRNLRRAARDRSDTTSILMGLENGASASLFCSLATTVSYRFAVFGSKGAVELLTPGLEFRFTPLPVGRAAGGRAVAEPEILTYEGFDMIAAELEAFAAAAGGGPSYPMTADEVLHGVAALEAIARSAELARAVTL
jgi:predicted dehydrogenase